MDAKYVLALELDDPGFDHSVLSDFRGRLGLGDRADRLLDPAVRRLKEAGLIKACGRQRADSIHILSAGGELIRLELATEAVRAVMEELARTAPEVLEKAVTAEWGERSGRPVRRSGGVLRPCWPQPLVDG